MEAVIDIQSQSFRFGILIRENKIFINTFVIWIIFYTKNLFKILFKALFSIDNLNNIKFYIFIYLMICVSTHISLSKKDFENSSIGIFSLFIIFFMITFICIMLNLNSILIIFINCLLYLSIFLTIGLIFSIVSLGIVFLLSLIN